jgi:hypothetical protein
VAPLCCIRLNEAKRGLQPNKRLLLNRFTSLTRMFFIFFLSFLFSFENKELFLINRLMIRRRTFFEGIQSSFFFSVEKKKQANTVMDLMVKNGTLPPNGDKQVTITGLGSIIRG